MGSALNTPKKVLGAVNHIPGFGHVKGVIHYLLGDREGGDEAMKAASRTIGVALGGFTGFAVGGSMGAYAGGALGGVMMDGIITVFDKAVNGSNGKAQGVFKHFVADDIIRGLLSDSIAGMSFGEHFWEMFMRSADKNYSFVSAMSLVDIFSFFSKHFLFV